MEKIITAVLSLNLFMGMATLTKEDFDVYIDNKLDNSVSVYKFDSEKYIILFSNHSKKYGDGVFFLDLGGGELYIPVVKKIELKDENKTLKINKSSIETPALVQVIDTNIEIKDNEIKVTTKDMPFDKNEFYLNSKIYKKEMLLKRR